MKPILKRLPARTGTALALALAIAAAACVPRPATPPPPPVQTAPTPAPAPAPVQAPVYDSWLDAPQTPGDWRYREQPGGGEALFGPANSEALVTLRCDRAARSVVIWRTGHAPNATQMTIRAEAQTRTLAATPRREALPAIEARLAANDRLLDAMALSKGRFAVEVPGTAPLYLPAWAEVTRVIEDCR